MHALYARLIVLSISSNSKPIREAGRMRVDRTGGSRYRHWCHYLSRSRGLLSCVALGSARVPRCPGKTLSISYAVDLCLLQRRSFLFKCGPRVEGPTEFDLNHTKTLLVPLRLFGRLCSALSLAFFPAASSPLLDSSCQTLRCHPITARSFTPHCPTSSSR